MKRLWAECIIKLFVWQNSYFLWILSGINSVRNDDHKYGNNFRKQNRYNDAKESETAYTRFITQYNEKESFSPLDFDSSFWKYFHAESYAVVNIFFYRRKLCFFFGLIALTVLLNS